MEPENVDKLQGVGKRSVRGIIAFSLAALVIPLAEPVRGEPPAVLMAEPPAVAAPPRTASNILGILDARKLDDPEGFDRHLRRANEEPPKDASKNTRARFYFERGTAADRVGRARQAIDDLTKANGLGAGLPLEERLGVLRALVSAELSGGNSRRALGYLRDSVALSGSLQTPEAHRVRLYARYASVLAEAGKLVEAKKSLAEAMEITERIAKYIRRYIDESDSQSNYGSPVQKTLWNVVGDDLIAVTAWARGELLRMTGRYIEAEAAYRTSIEYYQKDQAEDRVNAVRADLAATLAARGRHMEAEIAIRHALLFALRTYGRDNPRTGSRVRRLADILDAQGRITEAENVYRAALDIFAKTGTAPEAREFLAARGGLGGNLARQKRWGEALAQFRAALAGGADNSDLLDRYVYGNPDYAFVLIKNGRFTDGLAMARWSADRAKKIKGKNHVETATAEGFAAMSLASIGRERDALNAYARSSAGLLTHLAQGDGDSRWAVSDWRIKTVLQSYLRLLTRAYGTALDAKTRRAALADAFRVSDGLRGRKVQHSLNLSAARAAARTPILARLIRRLEELSVRLAALESLYADALSEFVDGPQEMARPGAEVGVRASPHVATESFPSQDSNFYRWTALAYKEAPDFSARLEERIERMAAERGLELGLSKSLNERVFLTHGYQGPMWQRKDYIHDNEGDYPDPDTTADDGRFFGNLESGTDAADRLEERIESMAAERGLELGFTKQRALDAQRGVGSKARPVGSFRFSMNRKETPAVPSGPIAANSLAQEIAELGVERAELRAKIQRRFPAYAALMAPQLPTIDRTRERLKPDQALIATYSGESETYVWAVPKRGKMSFAVVPMGKAILAAAVGKLRRGLEYRDDTLAGIPVFDVELAHALYKTLLEPVAPGWKDAKDLLVVAHGPLGRLPFSLLVTGEAGVKDGNRALFSGYKDVPWLIRGHSVTTLPTVAAMFAPRRAGGPASKRRRFVGFADPWFNAAQAKEVASQTRLAGASAPAGDEGILLRAVPRRLSRPRPGLQSLPRLPQTAAEIRGIALALGADPDRDIFTGRRSNEQQVKSMDLIPYRVVAFATHALVPYELHGLTQAALALTAPNVADVSGDGLLTMDEILRLRLDADWVVLSGCNTGNTGTLGSEAVSGLGRAFLHAGARSLLITQWEVESTVAKTLVIDLFRRQADDARLSRAQALRRAQLALVDGPGYVDTDGSPLFSYAHPLFWAPFTLFGEAAEAHGDASQKLGALPKN